MQTSNIPSSSTSSLSATSMTPPPLPARKGVGTPGDERTSPRSLPSRQNSTNDSDSSPQANTSLPERKQFGAHLPPPTRTIALGDKLPPPRRPTDGSSSEEEEEEDVKMKIDLLPDASRASRRPPIVKGHKYTEPDILIPAYTGSVAVSGYFVAVATSHHLRIHDLSRSDFPIWIMDSSSRSNDFNIKIKDFKMTSIEFRPTTSLGDRGAFLWIGTKDGHLIELDVRTAKVAAFRPAVHAHTVTHMFRHGLSMVTLDDTGKVLVWVPPDDEDLALATQTPRVVRIPEKQEFAKMLGGQLWTSSRDPFGGASVSKGPCVRVYDVYTHGSVGRSLLPTEHLGAVTAATVLPSDPGQAYLAHEGGHISIWAIAGTGAGAEAPVCVEVVKVSSSDILSLEGVNDRLWAGGRKGAISAYDVTSKPWTVTNSWMAHQQLPVLRIAVDTWSMEKMDRLMVFSVGRDEKIRFWDGLLGVDWIGEFGFLLL